MARSSDLCPRSVPCTFKILLGVVAAAQLAILGARSATLYQLDNGSVITVLNASDGTEPLDNWFGNVFTVVPGANAISRVDFGVFTTTSNSVASVSLYRVTDPGGNPALGATRLYTQGFTPLTGNGTNGFFQHINLTNPVSLTVGDKFLVSVLIRNVSAAPTNDVYPFLLDTSGDPTGTFWDRSSPNAFNLDDLTAALPINQAFVPGGFTPDPGHIFIRAFGTVLQPAILIQPQGGTVIPGSNVVISVTADGVPPLHYQWRLNQLEVPGQTNQELVLPSCQISNGGAYDVVVTNAYGITNSAPALLQFDPAYVPFAFAADLFNQRIDLNSTSHDQVQAANLGATLEPGEPRHGGKVGGASVWFSWTAPFNGWARFTTAGSPFDTLLGVYLGNNVSALATVAGDDDSGGYRTSQVAFYALGGTTYQIAVDGFAAAQGIFLLGWALDPTPVPPPFINTRPCDLTVPLGSNATFCVQASGPALVFQWYHDDVPIPFAINSVLVITNCQPLDVGFYRVTVADSLNLVTNFAGPAELQLGPFPDFRAQRKLEDLAGVVVPPNCCHTSKDDIVLSGFASVAAGVPGYQIFENPGASTAKYLSCETQTSTAMWMGLRPLADGILILNTFGSFVSGTNAMDTWLALFYDSTNPTPSLLHFVVCNDDVSPGVVTSRLQADVQAGTNYIIMTEGIRGTSGVLKLNWALGQAPSIQTPPASQQAVAGQTATLGVTAAGTPPLAYQWQFNGTNLAGRTGTNLVLSPVSLANAGNYRVIVANAFGSVTSTSATLTVVTLPTIYWPLSSQSTNRRRGEALTLYAGFTNGTIPMSFSWRKDQSLLSGQTGSQLVRSALQTNDAGLYSAVVSNVAGRVTNSGALVAVETPVHLNFALENTGSQVQLHLQGSALLGWVVQAASNVSPPTVWASVYTNRLTNGSFVNLDFRETLYSNSWLYPRRYYRAAQWP